MEYFIWQTVARCCRHFSSARSLLLEKVVGWVGNDVDTVCVAVSLNGNV